MITQPQKTYLAYELDDDIDAGFRAAVLNNQTALALQYALLILARQDKKIMELEEKVNATTTKKTTSSSSRSTRKRKDDDADAEN